MIIMTAWMCVKRVWVCGSAATSYPPLPHNGIHMHTLTHGTKNIIVCISIWRFEYMQLYFSLKSVAPKTNNPTNKMAWETVKKQHTPEVIEYYAINAYIICSAHAPYAHHKLSLRYARHSDFIVPIWISNSFSFWLEPRLDYLSISIAPSHSAHKSTRYE